MQKGTLALRNGRYVASERLARTRLADVYLGTDAVLDRVVTITFPHAVSADRTVASQWAGLTHPALTRLWDADLDGDRPFLVAEHVESVPLGEMRNMSSSEIALIGSQVASGLRFAHDRGLAHGSVSARTIRVARDGTAKVDAPPAWFTDMPHATPADDVFCLGAALSGAMHSVDPGDQAGEWSALLARMTAFLPENRPTAAQVVMELRNLAPADTEATVRYLWSVPIEGPARHRAKRALVHRAPLIAAAAALAVIGLDLAFEPVTTPSSALDAAVFGAQLPLFTFEEAAAEPVETKTEEEPQVTEIVTAAYVASRTRTATATTTSKASATGVANRSDKAVAGATSKGSKRK